MWLEWIKNKRKKKKHKTDDSANVQRDDQPTVLLKSKPTMAWKVPYDLFHPHYVMTSSPTAPPLLHSTLSTMPHSSVSQYSLKHPRHATSVSQDFCIFYFLI